MSRSWFPSVFGFTESKDFEHNRSAVAFDSASYVLTCPDGGRLYVGPFECPSLGELCGKVKEGDSDGSEEHRRQRLQELQRQAAPGAAVACPRPGGLVFGEVWGNVQDMHAMPENNGAVFMVASQVNCLEMVGPSVTPEAGISCYQNVKAPTAAP